MICKDDENSTPDGADCTESVEPAREQRLLPIAEIRQRLEKLLGRRPSLQTMYRWTLKGSHGVILETVRVGHALFATAEAVEQFIAESTAARLAEGPAARIRNKRQRSQAHAAAMRRCAELGIVGRIAGGGAKKMPTLSVSVGEAAPNGSTAGASHAPI